MFSFSLVGNENAYLQRRYFYSCHLDILFAVSISTNSFQCPDNFYPYLDLSCITFVTEPRNFADAVNYAQGRNGTLLTTDEQDLVYVSRYLDTVFVNDKVWVNSSAEETGCTSLQGTVISGTPCSTELPFLVVISYHGKLFCRVVANCRLH